MLVVKSVTANVAMLFYNWIIEFMLNFFLISFYIIGLIFTYHVKCVMCKLNLGLVLQYVQHGQLCILL